jgi:hypothetical protein
MPIRRYSTNARWVETENPTISAENAVNQINPPFTEREQRYAQHLIETETAQVKEADRQNSLADLHAKEKETASLEMMLEAIGPQIEQATSRLERLATDGGSPFLGLVCYLCLLTCIFAEYSISLSTLSFVLDINRNTHEAQMLALSVVSAMMILKIVVARLIWDPWEKARTQTGLGGKRVRQAIGAVFLLFVGLMTTFMVTRISYARQEATKVLIGSSLAGGKTAPVVDQKKIDAAVYAISICMAINGALFFVIGHTEMKKAVIYHRSLTAYRHLLSRQSQLEEALALSKRALAIYLDDWQRITERSNLAAAHYRTRLMLLLEQALKRRPPRRTNREMIDDLLGSDYER